MLWNIELFPLIPRALMFLCFENDLTAFCICNGMHSHLQVITQLSLTLLLYLPIFQRAFIQIISFEPRNSSERQAEGLF